MSNIRQALWVETLKARRSRMPVLTALGFALLPLVGGFFMIILKDPELARRVGLISAKARIMTGTADWPTFLAFLAQAIAGGGVVLFGLIGSWVFGREYSDHTVKDLLALPTPRSAIVLAKFVVVAVWSAGLTVEVFLAGLCIGAAVGLPQLSMTVVLSGGAAIALTACLVIVLVTPITFVASAGRGYLPPLGFMFLVLFLTQVTAVAGWGEYFPWAIPLLYAQGQGQPIGPASYGIVILTSIAGIVGTFAWWVWADQTG